MGHFQPAIKYASYLRLGIIGASGSGKTYTGLAIGAELGPRLAVVDTEHGSAAKYAKIFPFDHVVLDPPYTPERFIALINEAVAGGYDVLILDSISHAWSGTGGVLDIKDDYAMQKGFTDFTAWRPAGKEQDKFVEAILGAGIHIICTMRSKTKYVMEQGEKGKSTVKKLGLAPVQRDNMEYEFDVILDMNMENTGVVLKTRCPALVKKKIWPLPGEELAQKLLAWLGGVERPPAPPKPPGPHWSVTNRGGYMAQLEKAGVDDKQACELMGITAITEYEGTGQEFFIALKKARNADQDAELGAEESALQTSMEGELKGDPDPLDTSGSGGFDGGGKV